MAAGVAAVGASRRLRYHADKVGWSAAPDHDTGTPLGKDGVTLPLGEAVLTLLPEKLVMSASLRGTKPDEAGHA